MPGCNHQDIATGSYSKQENIRTPPPARTLVARSGCSASGHLIYHMPMYHFRAFFGVQVIRCQRVEEKRGTDRNRSWHEEEIKKNPD